MDIANYFNVIYFTVTFIFALSAIGWHRIKELFPVSIISIIVVGIVNIMGINLGLFQYNKPLLDVFGIPLFHLLWAGIAGIVFIEYMKPNFTHNLRTLIYATALVEALAYISDLLDNFQPLGNYNYYYDTLLAFASLAAILILSESLYKYRIYGAKDIK